MKLTEEIVVEKELLARNLQENWEENAGDLNIKKLFNKCILINKWKNYGPQTRPAGPPAAARSRLLGWAPSAADTHRWTDTLPLGYTDRLNALL